MYSHEEVSPQTTETLEQLPRVFNRRSALSERRQQIIQQKQTDALPALTTEVITPATKSASRQMVQLREENRHLHRELEQLRAEAQVLRAENAREKQRFEAEVAVIHTGHQHELAHFQSHLEEAMNERNHLHDEYTQLLQQHQELTDKLTRMIEEEVQKHINELVQEAGSEPEHASPQLQELMQRLALQTRQDTDRHLSEARMLKREVLRVADLLEKERQQLNDERQQVVALQASIRGQAILRERSLQSRLYARWRVASIGTAFGLLVLLVILQMVCLSLFHFTSASLAILAPVIVCVCLAFVLTSPLTMLKHMYLSSPHRKKKLQQ
jgi:hypothetical protein